MNNDDKTARLLDTAVPPIPAGLRIPPYARIRARARRRRMAVILTASATAVILVIAVLLAAALRPSRSTVVGGHESPSSTATADPDGATVALVQARVSRSGTEVTVYVNPPGRCSDYTEVSPMESEDDTAVRITLRVSTGPAECESALVTTATVTLTRPLGNRTVIDGVTGEPVPTFDDVNLPRVPAAWTEVHSGFTRLDGPMLRVRYTGTGGPDLVITASPGGGLDSAPIERLRLGSHDGVIVPGAANSYNVDWMVGDLLYEMWLEPSEGGSVSLSQVHAIIAQLAWS